MSGVLDGPVLRHLFGANVAGGARHPVVALQPPPVGVGTGLRPPEVSAVRERSPTIDLIQASRASLLRPDCSRASAERVSEPE